MSVERAAALTMFILPALVAFCAGVWKVFVWAVDRHDERPPAPVEARIQQGEVIEPPNQWADRAYQGVMRELEDERADHAHTMHRHRHCHARMEEAGMTVPDDH